MTCRTRFAPSPTGYLHIGGARTALYCWLERAATAAQFILRIEDTDRERSTQAAIDAILEAMEWLGLDYDEGPIYQTQRLDRYREVAEQLVAAGTAYYAYETQGRTRRDARGRAWPRGEKPRYDGRWRDRERCRYRDDPEPVIRFKNPLDGDVSLDDKVKGRIEIAQQRARRPGDPPLRRLSRPTTSPSWSTTSTWSITDVIRGDDHVNNTPRQINIYRALGAPVPQFAHLPMILGARRRQAVQAPRRGRT